MGRMRSHKNLMSSFLIDIYCCRNPYTTDFNVQNHTKYNFGMSMINIICQFDHESIFSSCVWKIFSWSQVRASSHEISFWCSIAGFMTILREMNSFIQTGLMLLVFSIRMKFHTHFTRRVSSKSIFSNMATSCNYKEESAGFCNMVNEWQWNISNERNGDVWLPWYLLCWLFRMTHRPIDVFIKKIRRNG